MIGLALRSLRHRATAFTATAVAVLLGTALMGSFATLVETADGPVSAADQDTLVVMGAVIGGWGSLIVLFAVASTTGVTVAQRHTEVGLLRSIGACRTQVRRLVVLEIVTVCALASTIGAGFAAFGGRALLTLLQRADMVSGDVPFGGGVLSLSVTAGAVIVTCLLAAAVTARRATVGPPSVAPPEEIERSVRLRWWRIALGLGLVAYGVTMGVVTVTVTAHSDDPYAAMATSGSSSILVGMGLALLAPPLLAWAARLAGPVVRRPVGRLALTTASRRAGSLGGVLGPVVVLTAASVGTFLAVSIDRRTAPATVAADTELINLLNNVVVGMLSLFAAIMVLTSYVALVVHRRDDLRRLRLLGAGPGQVRGSILIEAGVVAVVGLMLGLLASLATIVPFSVAREEGVVPDGGLWLAPVLAGLVIVVTTGSAALALRRVRADLSPAAAVR